MHLCDRILLNGSGEQHPEAADVFFVNLRDVATQPARTKIDARQAFPHVVVRGARVEALLEKRDAGFVPQAAAKHERRVGSDGDDWRGQCLRDVVHLDKLLRRHLQVYLKTGVASLQQRRVVLHQQFVHTLHAQLKRGAEQVFLDGCHEREVAVFGREVVHLQVVLAQRGQYTREADAGIILVEHFLDNGQIFKVFGLHIAQASTRELAGAEVGLEVEFCQFRDAPIVLFEVFEHLHVDARGLEGLVVYEAHFLLCTDAGDIRLEPVVGKHILEGLHIVEQAAHKVLHLAFAL